MEYIIQQIIELEEQLCSGKSSGIKSSLLEQIEELGRHHRLVERINVKLRLAQKRLHEPKRAYIHILSTNPDILRSDLTSGKLSETLSVLPDVLPTLEIVNLTKLIGQLYRIEIQFVPSSGDHNCY
jgi:hypothetical protein